MLLKKKSEIPFRDMGRHNQIEDVSRVKCLHKDATLFKLGLNMEKLSQLHKVAI